MIRLGPHLSTADHISATAISENGLAGYFSAYNPRPVDIPSADTEHRRSFYETFMIIKVEGALFPVHKHQLAKSNFFSEIFTLSQFKDRKPQEGSSPDHPFVIEGTSASDFDALLKVLNSSCFSGNQPGPEADLVDPAFRLANLLGFSDLRAYLLPFAEKSLDDIEKIVFARKFHIKEWLEPAFARICRQDKVLSMEEAEKLGLESVLWVWRVREENQIRSSRMTNIEHTYGTGRDAINKGTREWMSHQTYYYPTHQRGYTFDGPAMIRSITEETGLEGKVRKWVEENYRAHYGSDGVDWS